MQLNFATNLLIYQILRNLWSCDSDQNNMLRQGRLVGLIGCKNFWVVIQLTRVFYERTDHCEQNGYQSDKLIFHIWSWTSAPKLKTIWYAAKVVVQFDPLIALSSVFNRNFAKNYLWEFHLRSVFLLWRIISNFHIVSVLFFNYFYVYCLNSFIFPYKGKQNTAINSSQFGWNRWLIDDYCRLKWFSKLATTNSSGCCFLLEITQYAHQMDMLSIHGSFWC